MVWINVEVVRMERNGRIRYEILEVEFRVVVNWM